MVGYRGRDAPRSNFCANRFPFPNDSRRTTVSYYSRTTVSYHEAGTLILWRHFRFFIVDPRTCTHRIVRLNERFDVRT